MPVNFDTTEIIIIMKDFINTVEGILLFFSMLGTKCGDHTLRKWKEEYQSGVLN